MTKPSLAKQIQHMAALVPSYNARLGKINKSYRRICQYSVKVDYKSYRMNWLSHNQLLICLSEHFFRSTNVNPIQTSNFLSITVLYDQKKKQLAPKTHSLI